MKARVLFKHLLRIYQEHTGLYLVNMYTVVLGRKERFKI